MRGLKKTLGRLAAAPAALALTAGTAMASTGGGGSLPWDGPLQIIEQDLSGTVAHTFVIIAIVTTGLFWAFGEHGSSMRKVMGIAAGGSMALGAASLISSLGLGSGAVIGGPRPVDLLIALPAATAALLLLLVVVALVAGVMHRPHGAAAELSRHDCGSSEADIDGLRMLIVARRQRQKEWGRLHGVIHDLLRPVPLVEDKASV